MEDPLTDEQRRVAAAGDLNVLAVLMLLGSTGFALANVWFGTLGWIAAAATIASALATSMGLLRRNDALAAMVKIGFGAGGLAAPILFVAGLVLGAFGIRWGWALAAGAVLYFGFSLLGLEILHRAEATGVIDPL